MREFYSMNPREFRKYLPYYREKLRQETEQRNELIDITAWVNGIYVSHAIGQLGKHRYPEKPLNLFGAKSLEQQDETETTPEKVAAEGFAGFAYMFNLERKKKREKEMREAMSDGGH